MYELGASPILVSPYQRYGAGEWTKTFPFSGPRERTRHFWRRCPWSIVYFRGIEALALLLNSLLFPFLRGSSGPGLSMLGLGSLGRKIQMSVSGARSLESIFCLFEFKSSRITRAFPCTAELFLVFILLWLEEQSERCICLFSSSVP